MQSYLMMTDTFGSLQRTGYADSTQSLKNSWIIIMLKTAYRAMNFYLMVLLKGLMEVTEQALYDGLGQALAGNKVVDISRAIQGTAEANGYSIVREFVGHGVGKKVHEDPQIPNFDDGGRRSPVLKPGMTLAIEPMVNLGQRHVEMLEDGWTVVARDGLPSAHFEHTILVTDEIGRASCRERV